MSTDIVFQDPALEALRRRYFPRVPWGPEGPVRRRYLARAVPPDRDVAEALEALAQAEGFVPPGQRPFIGGAAGCLAAFQGRGAGETLVFGRGLDVHWCDLALGGPAGDGWQPLIVRSEQAENLVALAHALGAVRFRKWEKA